MGDDDRPVTMLAGDHDITRIIYHLLDREFGVEQVVVEDPVDRATFLRRRVRRLGAATVAGQVAFRVLCMPALAELARGRIDEIVERAGMDRRPIPSERKVEVDSVNDPATVETLRATGPEVVVISGTRIIDEAVLESVSAPFLNMHAGVTPMYRGVHGGYWALAEGDSEHCGVTVHELDAGIDTGGIISQATIEPTEADNFASYPYLQFEAGLPLLRDAVEDAVAGELETVDGPEGESNLWSHPTVWEYVYNRLMYGVR